MQYRLCKTEDEARAELKAYQNCNQRDEVGYCPLIQNMCNKKCVCFLKPSMRKDKDDKGYHVYGARCSNAMFFKK